LAIAVLAASLCAAEPRLAELRTIPLPELTGVEGLAFTPDGKTLVVIGSSSEPKPARRESRGAVRFLNVANGAVRAAWSGHADEIVDLAISPDGRLLVTAGMQELLLWRLPSGQEAGRLKRERSFKTGLAFSQDSERLAMAGDSEVRVWQVAMGRELLAFTRPVREDAVAFSHDLRLLAAANYQDVDLWSLETGKPGGVLEDHRGGVRAVAFRPDGKALAVLSTTFNPFPEAVSALRFWNPADGKELGGARELPGYGWSMKYSPDGKRLALLLSREIGVACMLKILDAATGRDLAALAFTRADLPTRAPTFGPDGRVLAIGTSKAVRLLRFEPGQER